MRPDEPERPPKTEAEPAGTRFLVLTTPRSGSTWLLDLLRQLPGTTAYGELFLPRRKPRAERSMTWKTAEYLDRNLRGHPLFCESSARLGWRPGSVISYLDDLYRPPGAVGFKAMYANLVRYPELWAYVVARRLRVVHLVRVNLLDVVVSEHVRSATRTVHRIADEPAVAIDPIRIEPVEIVHRIRRSLRRRRIMRRLLRSCRVEHLEVTYEALVRDPGGLTEVRRFLSIDEGGLPPRSELQKLVDRPHSEIVRNYDEVIRALVDSGLDASSWT